MRTMRLSKPIPIRLGQDVIDRLDKAAERLGTNRSALIKFCAETFVEHFERHGGIASMPPNWQELLRSLDGRSRIIQTVGNHNHHFTLRADERSPACKSKKRKKKK